MAQLLGETARAMEEGEARHLEMIINKEEFKKKDSYYILKTSQLDGNVIRTRYTMRSKRPVLPIVKSKLWLVDNRQGHIDLIWDLPAQYVGAEAFASDNEKDICPHALKSAVKAAPILSMQK